MPATLSYFKEGFCHPKTISPRKLVYKEMYDRNNQFKISSEQIKLDILVKKINPKMQKLQKKQTRPLNTSNI